MKCVTCLTCGWVHMGISRASAEENVQKFNEVWCTMSAEEQNNYGGKASIQDYMRCFLCGGPWTNFRPFEPGDCPDGVTIQAIIQDY